MALFHSQSLCYIYIYIYTHTIVFIVIYFYFVLSLGNAFAYHNGYRFSAKDMDFDDNSQKSCAKSFKGGWWYRDCHRSNLNGQYLRGKNTTFGRGVIWKNWRGHQYSLKKTVMKIRPRTFNNNFGQ